MHLSYRRLTIVHVSNNIDQTWNMLNNEVLNHLVGIVFLIVSRNPVCKDSSPAIIQISVVFFPRRDSSTQLPGSFFVVVMTATGLSTCL